MVTCEGVGLTGDIRGFSSSRVGWGRAAGGSPGAGVEPSLPSLDAKRILCLREKDRERESEREMEGSGLLHNFLHGQAQMNYVLTENTDNSQYLNTYAESRMSMITSTKTPNTLPNVFNESSATAERAKERETSLRPIVNYFSLLPARQNIPSACLRPK